MAPKPSSYNPQGSSSIKMLGQRPLVLFSATSPHASLQGRPSRLHEARGWVLLPGQQQLRVMIMIVNHLSQPHSTSPPVLPFEVAEVLLVLHNAHTHTHTHTRTCTHARTHTHTRTHTHKHTQTTTHSAGAPLFILVGIHGNSLWPSALSDGSSLGQSADLLLRASL